MRDNNRDFAAEFLARQQQDPSTALSGEPLELSGALQDFVPEENPDHELHETLRRNAAGADPVPHMSDDDLYRRFKEVHDG